MNRLSNSGGFTVVELSAILGVIALSAAVLTPGFSGTTSNNTASTIETVSGSSVVFAEPETLPVEAILVNITNTATGQTVSRTVNDPDATSTTFTGLDPQANYTVEVAKKSQAGKSSAAKAFLRYEKTGEKIKKTGIRDVEKEIEVPVIDITKPIAWEMVEKKKYRVERMLEVEIEEFYHTKNGEDNGEEYEIKIRGRLRDFDSSSVISPKHRLVRYAPSHMRVDLARDLGIFANRVIEAVENAVHEYEMENADSFIVTKVFDHQERRKLERSIGKSLEKGIRDALSQEFPGTSWRTPDVDVDLHESFGKYYIREIEEIEDLELRDGSIQIGTLALTYRSDVEIEMGKLGNYGYEMVPDVSKPKAWGTKIEKKKVIETEEYEYEEDEKKSHTREKEIDVDDKKVIIRSSVANPKRNNSWTIGTIIAVGEDVKNFSVGDVVSYRQGKPFRFDGEKYIEAKTKRFLLRKQ